MGKNNFQSLLQRFFLERLINQMNASPCTVSSYRDTFRILLKYFKDEKNVSVCNVSIESISAENVLGFLNHLKNVRGNSISTLNNRLAAIHSFMGYVAYQNPEYLSTVQKVKAIPFKRHETKSLGYLSNIEVEAIMDACDLNTWLGRRDRIMVTLLYNTGARVTELVSIRIQDIELNHNSTSTIQITGKGRKQRVVPLWKTTRASLTEFIKETNKIGDDYLFTSYGGEKLSRSGVKYRLDCLIKAAAVGCPSLLKKRVTPHTYRHTTAVHMLQSGIDISTIAIWLGHESIETTHKYMTADLRLKERALSQVKEPDVKGFRYQPPSDILSFLDTL